MCRTVILALPAGRKLDALLAERVMGWRQMPADPWTEAQARNLPDAPPRRTSRWETDRPGVCYQILAHGGESGIHYPPLPCFSMAIAAAWEVVEKLGADGLRLELESVAGADGPHDAWRAVLSGADRYGAAYGPTAPLAICRAAFLSTLGPAQ